MNEQLIVKNFGPIKDATVDFKRVTVFIGPTGGGKSTLAKLAAVFRNDEFFREKRISASKLFSYNADKYELAGEVTGSTNIIWNANGRSAKIVNSSVNIEAKPDTLGASPHDFIDQLSQLTNTDLNKVLREKIKNNEDITEVLNQLFGENKDLFLEFTSKAREIIYVPAERVFLISALNSLSGLLTAKIALPENLLDFGRAFEQARKTEKNYILPFLGVEYRFENNVDIIKLDNESIIKLSKAASGIQSTLPMLLILHSTSSTPGPDSFIIEEPELNLFPSAQYEAVKMILNYSSDAETDLVITTHSPYVLTALNLLCYAYRIAQQDEATAKKVAKLIPRHCWIDPDQFAAYYVDRPDTKRKQQVRSIINKKTGLIEENELDTASDELGAIFDKLVRLRKPTPTPSRAK
jgi:predicted ATPase